MFEKLKILFNPAGGVRYHIRAYSHRETLWSPFRNAITLFLEDWKPESKKLIIVGPSAGYMLPYSFLSRFSEITAIDPEPLAEVFFRKLHPGLNLKWVKSDFIITSKGRLLAEFIKLHPDHAVLFSGFLGQLRLLSKTDKDFEETKDMIKKCVLNDEREWASFHDRVSGPWRPMPRKLLSSFSTRLDDQEMIKMFYSDDENRLTQNRELTDHYTDSFFPEVLRHSYCSWELTPAWFHLIECVHN